MATESQARAARDLAWSEYDTLFGMRPRAIGIVVSREGDHFVKVTLPREARDTPRELQGVGVLYDFAETAAELVSRPEAPWMAAVRRARRKIG